MSNTQRVLLFAASTFFAASGCGLRTLDVLIHTPKEEDCAEERAGLPPPIDPECPLAALRSVESRMIRVDGTVHARECQGVLPLICDYEDLAGFLFLGRTEASDGIEVVLTGRDGAACGGDLVMRCDSFGDAVIDLTTAAPIPIWCPCPRTYEEAP